MTAVSPLDGGRTASMHRFGKGPGTPSIPGFARPGNTWPETPHVHTVTKNAEAPLNACG